MTIQVRNISKQFHQDIVLDDINLDVEKGELVALLGPSGSGKTTLLRIIAGLEQADSGSILFEGEEAQTKSPKERKVGFVFQHYALFKHMTVFENVAFGLKVKSKKVRLSEDDIRAKVMKLLKLMHLENYPQHFPHQLSGGQQQRVALVRALAIDPEVLLLDEPFGALDAKVRKELCRWIRMLHDEIQVSSIFVTHDQDEAMEVADRIAIMNKGKIVQIGTPDEIWHQPVNRFVYDFIGTHNAFKGYEDENGQVHLLNLNDDINGQGKEIVIYARPYEIFIATTPNGEDYVEGKIVHINATGSLVKLEVRMKGGKIFFVETPYSVFEELNIKREMPVFLRPKTFDFYEYT